MTFDELCEHLDELGISGDTPLVFKDEDGSLLEVECFNAHTHNGTVEVILLPAEV